MLKDQQIKGILKEAGYKTSRSGGKGGQNVNKVESKVELSFNVKSSAFLSDDQKQIVLSRFPSISSEGEIRLVGSANRSQLQNKEDVKNRLIGIINKLLKPVKKRKATKPSKGSKEKKLKEKKRKSEIKEMRKKLF
jgi:ribosome-associated protein